MDYISLILCVLHKTNSFQNMYFYTIKKRRVWQCKETILRYCFS